MSKKFEIVRPKSLNNSLFEDFEYLICWRSRTGGFLQYMFYEAEFNNNINGKVINQENTNIKALNESESQTIILTANDVSRIDYLAISQMFSNTHVFRLKKDGTQIKYAPDRNKFKYLSLIHI